MAALYLWESLNIVRRGFTAKSAKVSQRALRDRETEQQSNRTSGDKARNESPSSPFIG